MQTRIVWYGQRVVQRYERSRVRVLKRSGALFRTIWRRLIRFRKRRNSKAGDPPFAHTRGFGIRSIFWSYDRLKRETVIGPLLHTDQQAAESLAFGGFTKVRLPRSLRKQLGRKRLRVRIEARPGGQIANEKFATKYPDLWRNAIR